MTPWSIVHLSAGIFRVVYLGKPYNLPKAEAEDAEFVKETRPRVCNTVKTNHEGQVQSFFYFQLQNGGRKIWKRDAWLAAALVLEWDQFRLIWEAIPLSVLPPTSQPLLSHQANTPLRCWHSVRLWFVVYGTGYRVRQIAVALVLSDFTFNKRSVSLASELRSFVVLRPSPEQSAPSAARCSILLFCFSTKEFRKHFSLLLVISELSLFIS